MPPRRSAPVRLLAPLFVLGAAFLWDHLHPAFAQSAALPDAASTSVADLLDESGDLSVPDNRRRAVERVRVFEEQRRAAAEQLARARGLPLRVERPDGTVRELVDFNNDRPVYLTTHNTNAAISTGASVLRATPYGLVGSGVFVGVWDGGAVRAAHQEFAADGRVVVKDGAASIDHATHVAGTIAAAGVVASARGMASAALVDSYDWNSDKSELAARGATGPAQADKLYLSNHSYGYVSGWNYVNGGSPYRLWEWTGDGSAAVAVDTDFGRYNTYARDSDSLAFSVPYLLMFRSAGNDRVDSPSAGQLVALAAGSSTVVAYDPALHPAGDSSYRGGFETIGFDALAKNVITIGSVADAVASGLRDPSKAAVSSFSSWGPTDDGRVKPDLVANGDGVYSSLNGSNAAYGGMSGTSMATPNATGTAVLLVQEYSRLFPGGAMRSATLKGLLIHTADDRGNTGPDYKFGWGLLNGQAAADLLRDHAANPLKVRLAEELATAGVTTITREFVWDGVSPIRATLAWTDPAGSATTTSDLRTPRLRNNLDLKIVGPDGSEHLPFVLPFVGAWTQASMDLPATTGKNNTDNVEQVRIAAPPAPGVYRAVVTFDGTLANNQQAYSLLLSGSANEEPPPPPLGVTSVSPASGLPGPVTLDLGGAGFDVGAEVRLLRSGQTDRVASSTELVGETLRAQVDLTGAAAGSWDLRVTNPDGETVSLASAFSVVGALWSETFDGTVSGWASTAETGTNSWSPATAQSHTPARSYFASGPATKTTTSLVSPAFNVPSGAANLQFKFWHRHDLQTGRDGGRLEFSVGGGSWFDITASGSGTAFASNGYNGTISNTGNPNSRSDFAGLRAWTGGSGAFVETIVNLADTAKFAGKTLRARWRLATDGGTASAGWHVDTISLVGGGDLGNAAPVITTSAATTGTETATDTDGTVYAVVRGLETGLSVAATDDGGAENLTYAWSAASASGTPLGFLPDGDNAARLSTAYFEGLGDYFLTVTVRDAQGLAAASTVAVRVLATADSVEVTPAVASVVVGGAQSFAATVLDQFGNPLASQPASYSWTASGGGMIDATGLFAANATGGPFTITAVSGDLSGSAGVTVNRAPATVILSGLERLYTGAPLAVGVMTDPAGLAVSVTYDGVASAPSAAGGYAVVATVTDTNYQGGASATLVIRTGLDAWAESLGLTGDAAAPTADPDADGTPNLLEYALGGDPVSAGRAPVEAAVIEGRLALVFTRIADPGLVYTVEASDDLAQWSVLAAPGNPSTGETNIAGPAFIVDTRELAASPRRFLRLRVSY